jgi:hypothetical protein
MFILIKLEKSLIPVNFFFLLFSISPAFALKKTKPHLVSASFFFSDNIFSDNLFSKFFLKNFVVKINIVGKLLLKPEELIPHEIHLMPTDNTPEIHLNPSGIFNIQGRAITTYNTEFSDLILNWIDSYILNPAETTYVIIKFEYLNSYGTTILVSFFRKLLNVNLQSKKLEIIWYYEEEDDDMLEKGEYISTTLNIPIKFIVIDGITDCSPNKL